MKTNEVTDRQGFQSDDDKQKYVDNDKGSNLAEDAKTIEDELLHVKDGYYFVKVKDGKEVRLHTDKTTQMMGEIQKGDRVEAMVNEQNHAQSIRLARGTDADHGTVADRPRDHRYVWKGRALV